MIDTRTKLKFSWFFKNAVVELDKEAYGPDNHLSEWHREASSEECDGFTVRSPATSPLVCSLFLVPADLLFSLPCLALPCLASSGDPCW